MIIAGTSLITFLPASSNGQCVAGSDYFANIAFVDSNSNPYVPLSVSWYVYDTTNDMQVQGISQIGAPATVNTIDIPAACNVLNNPQNLTESRELVLLITVPGGTQRTDSATYYVTAYVDF